VLAGSQGAEMRELEGAGSPYAPVQVGNGEKGFRDKWAGCVVKRPTTTYGNGGERCKTSQGTANRRYDSKQSRGSK